MAFRAKLLVMIMALALAGGTVLACGGEEDESNGDSNASSSNDNGGDDDDDEGDEIPDLSELAGDADNHDLLFFTSPEPGNSALLAVDPASPEDTPMVVDDSMPEHAYQIERNFFPIHEASWDIDERQMSDFRVDRIFYFDPMFDGEGVRTVSTDADQSLPPEPKKVSSENYLMLEGKTYFVYSLENADETAVVYTIDFEDWSQIRMGKDGETAAKLFEPGHVPIGPSWAPEVSSGEGWLIVDTNDNNTLKMVDMELELVDGTVTQDGQPIDNIATNEAWSGGRVDSSVQPLGPIFGDGSQLLVIAEDDGTEEAGQEADLWYYQRGDAGEPGTAYPLLNEDSETLVFEAGGLSMAVPVLPAAEHIASDGETMFFLRSDLFGYEAQLYRADADGWMKLESVSNPGDFIIADEGRVIFSADDEVISVDREGEDRIVIDPDERLFGQSVDSPIIGSRDGWIFYNRAHSEMGDDTEFAVAAKVDGSELVQIKDARWIGASTTGRAEANSQIGAFELSEVFMLRDETELAAISAADPAAGAVRLGELPSGATDARMFGAAPGPHRLLQTIIEESPERHEVLYVNTREEDSLVTVSPEPMDSFSLRPVNLF